MARRGADSRADPVGTAADELYGLPPDEFTAARNEQARRARAQGDGETARAVGKLGKPSVVAWLANQLVRAHADEIRPLLELGDSMRRATAALDAGQLRELSRQQHQMVYALVQQAHGLASAAGQAVTDSTARGLEDTLHAALADEQAARQLSAGRLTSGLSRTGFPGVDGRAAEEAASRQVADKVQAAKRTGTSQAAARRDQLRRAQRNEAQTRRDAQEADQARDEAQATRAQADRAARDAADQVDRIRAELETALDAQETAGRVLRQARKDADRADRADRQAQRRLQEATARHKDLER